MKKILILFLTINILLWGLVFEPEIFIGNLEILILLLISLLLFALGLLYYAVMKRKYNYLIIIIVTIIIDSGLLFLAYTFKDGIL